MTLKKNYPVRQNIINRVILEKFSEEWVSRIKTNRIKNGSF